MIITSSDTVTLRIMRFLFSAMEITQLLENSNPHSYHDRVAKTEAAEKWESTNGSQYLLLVLFKPISLMSRPHPLSPPITET